jgi:hypothetical protein
MNKFDILGERRKGIFNPNLADKIVLDATPAYIPPVLAYDDAQDLPQILVADDRKRHSGPEWDSGKHISDGCAIVDASFLYRYITKLKSRLEENNSDKFAEAIKTSLESMFSLPGIYSGFRMTFDASTRSFYLHKASQSIREFPENPVYAASQILLKNINSQDGILFFQSMFETADSLEKICDTLVFGVGFLQCFTVQSMSTDTSELDNKEWDILFSYSAGTTRQSSTSIVFTTLEKDSVIRSYALEAKLK